MLHALRRWLDDLPYPDLLQRRQAGLLQYLLLNTLLDRVPRLTQPGARAQIPQYGIDYVPDALLLGHSRPQCVGV